MVIFVESTILTAIFSSFNYQTPTFKFLLFRFQFSSFYSQIQLSSFYFSESNFQVSTVKSTFKFLLFRIQFSSFNSQIQLSSFCFSSFHIFSFQFSRFNCQILTFTFLLFRFQLFRFQLFSFCATNEYFLIIPDCVFSTITIR
jgi:hypothetical protein